MSFTTKNPNYATMQSPTSFVGWTTAPDTSRPFTVLLSFMASYAFLSCLVLPASAQSPTPTASIVRFGLSDDANVTHRLTQLCHLTCAVPTPPASPGDVPVDLALGNDYQLLEWLETDQIDGAFLSPFVAWLLLNSSPQQSGYRVHILPLSDPATPVASRPPMDIRTQLRAVLAAARGQLPTPIATPIFMSSHLSVPGFVAPLLYVTRWLDASTTEAGAIEDDFWTAFFAQVQFTLGRELPLRPAMIAFDSHAVPGVQWHEYLDTAVQRQLSPLLTHELLILRAGLVPPGTDEDWLSLEQGLSSLDARQFDDLFDDTKPLGTHIRTMVARRAGSTSRPYSFTIPELISLLSHDQRRQGADGLALVLPGGGVKSAYQSEMVDYLYRLDGPDQPYLANSNRPRPGGTLGVDYVAGNSGGALLGAFAASLTDATAGRLSPILWGSPGQELSAHDVFPVLDMMRWLAVLACCTILWIVGCAFRRRPQFVAGPDSKDRVRRTPYTLGWFAMLFAAPIGFRYANGAVGWEHMPSAGGVFYFVCICIALYCDGCFVFNAPPAWRVHKRAVALGGIGAIACVLPLMARASVGLVPSGAAADAGEWWYYDTGLLRMSGLAFLYCAGVLITFIAYTWWHCRQISFRPDRPDIATGIGLALLVPIVAHAVVACATLLHLGPVSTLELVGAFWLWLLVAAGAASLAIFLIGAQTPAGPFRKGATALMSGHPASSVRRTRLGRMLLICAVAFVWWNVVVAPGVYGNDDAQRYLEDRVEAFAQDGHLELQTVFVAPATKIHPEPTGERYFVFCVRWTNGDCADARMVDVMARLERDARWLICKGEPLFLRRIVFASGSPFPIFPSHRISDGGVCKGRIDDEHLVDGGFSHNVPVEAAGMLGAHQLLVLASTPEMVAETTDPDAVWHFPLLRHLPRLLPYLLERAQVADRVRDGGLFVARIVPVGRRSWPKMYEFTRHNVAWLREMARNDRHAKVGRIDGWGTPAFARYTVAWPGHVTCLVGCAD